MAHWVDRDLVSARCRQRDVSEVDSERHHHQLAWIECRRRMFDLEPAGDLGESLLGFAYAGAKENSTRTAGTPKVEDPGGWDSMTGGGGAAVVTSRTASTSRVPSASAHS